MKEQSVNTLRPGILTHKKFINKEIIVVAENIPRNGYRSCTYPN